MNIEFNGEELEISTKDHQEIFDLGKVFAKIEGRVEFIGNESNGFKFKKMTINPQHLITALAKAR